MKALTYAALLLLSAVPAAATDLQARCEGLYLYAIVNGVPLPQPVEGDTVWVGPQDTVMLEARWSSGTCPDFKRVQWYRNDTAIEGANRIRQFQQSSCHVTQPGRYRLTHESGAMVGELEVWVRTGTALADQPETLVHSLFRMRVYPTAVQQELLVEGYLAQAAPLTLFVLNSAGRELSQVRAGEVSGYYRHPIPVGHLPPGVYHLLIECNEQKRVQRFVKQ